MNASKHKKTLTFLKKISTFEFQLKMQFKLSEFLEQFMAGTII